MNARSLELFKALSEASFWFYTHPKDTSYRLIYNKSRYTLDKPRIMKMLRLYLPFVRRLDDQALITYMYRNGGIVMAQMQSGQIGNLDIVSETLPNTLQAVNTLDLVVQQKAIDEAIAKEEEEQRRKDEEKKKKDEEKDESSKPRGKTPSRTPVISEKTRLEDLAKRAEKSDLSVANSGGVVIAPVDKPVTLIPAPIKPPTLVIANKSGAIIEPSNPRPSLTIPSGPKPRVGPDRFERAVGGTVGLLSGSPIMSAGKKIGSVGQIWVRKGSDYANKEIRRRFSRNEMQYSRYTYTEDEADDDYVSYEIAPKKEKRAWVFLGFGIWGWVLVFVGLGLIFSLMAGGDEEVATATEEKKIEAPISTGNGADYSACRFTRAGVSRGIGSTILTSWIRDAADKEGISPAVLASVSMHENPDFTANAKNDHDGITSGRMCGKSPTFCVLRGQVLHTKAYTTGENDPCTSSELANGAQTAQAVGLMQFLDIYNPGKDLCSIQTSLELAAAKLKGAGLGANPTEDQVTKAIKDYHVSCFYGSYNYCTEVYQDFQNCKPKPAGGSASCQGGWPVGGSINQGPWGGSHSEYQGQGMMALDIGAANGTPVYSTFKGVINELSYVDTGPKDGRGLFVSIQPELPGRNAVVRYLHFSNLAEGLKVGQSIDAGALLGYVGMSGRADGPHLHMDFKNIEMVPPYVPLAVTPLNCTSNCQPKQISACR